MYNRVTHSINERPSPVMPRHVQALEYHAKNLGLQVRVDHDETQFFPGWVISLMRNMIIGNRVTQRQEPCDVCGHPHVVEESYNCIPNPGELKHYRAYRLEDNDHWYWRPVTDMSEADWLNSLPVSMTPGDYMYAPIRRETIPVYFIPATPWDAAKVAIRRIFPAMTAPAWKPRYITTSQPDNKALGVLPEENKF